MKTIMLPLSVLAGLALAACENSQEPDPADDVSIPSDTLQDDADGRDGSDRNGTDLFDDDETDTAGTGDLGGRDPLATDDPADGDPFDNASDTPGDEIPPVSSTLGSDRTMPEGALAAGSWHEMGDSGVGFGPADSEPLIAFRCASDTDEVIVTRSGDLPGEASETSGAVITDYGQATGFFRTAGQELPTIEMRVPAASAAFGDLAMADRLAVTVQDGEPVLLRADTMLLDVLESCRS